MSYPYNKVTALTGVIGSGKSLAAEFFRENGATLVSADAIARAVVQQGTPGYESVVREFGPDVLTTDGDIDRKRLGAEVFKEESRRKLLESITHPLIQEAARASFIAALDTDTPLLIYDCPLFFEAGLDSFGFQNVVLVAAPRDLCIKRIMKRDGFSEAEAIRRIDSQTSLDIKRKQATHIIENDKSIDELRAAVTRVFESLVS